MNHNLLTAGALTALLAISTTGMTQQVASTDMHSVKAGSYSIETYHTQVVFTLSHFGFSNYSGLFSGASGTLTLDPARLSDAKLSVSVPTQSIQTTVPQLTDELKDDQWFDTKKYPDATFISNKVTQTGADTLRIDGELTLRGVTKPVVLTAHFIGAGTNPIDRSFTIGFEATGTLKRTDFGIKQYAPLLGDEVTLRISVAFVLKS